MAQVDVDGEGRAIAAWAVERRGRWSLLVAERRDGWSTPETVVADKVWRIRPAAIRLNDAGDAVVVFDYFNRSRTVALAAVRPRGGGWEEPQALVPVRNGIADPAVALGESGSVTTTGGAFFGGPGLSTTTRGLDGAWRGPTLLTRAESIPSVLLAASSDRVAVMSEAVDYLGGRNPRRRPVLFTGPIGGRLVPVRPLPADPASMTALAGAVGDDGRVMLAWREIPADGKRSRLLAARQIDGGGWSRPVVLDDERNPSEPAQIAVVGDRVVVAWTRWERLWETVSVRSAILDASGVAVATSVIDRFAVADIRGPGPSPSIPGPPPVRVSLAAGGGGVSALWSRLGAGLRTGTFATRLLSSDLAGSAWSPPTDVAGTAQVAGLLTFARFDGGMAAVWAGALSDGRVAGASMVTRQ